MSSLLALLALCMCLAAGLDRVEGRRAEAARRSAALRGEGRVIASLRAMGWTDAVGPFLVTARNGRTAEIDAVVLTDTGVAVVLESKNWGGTIHGGRSDSEWKSVKPDGSVVRHRNPVFQVERQARLLREATGQPCVGLVVMSGRGAPASGEWPRGVVALDSLRAAIPEAARSARGRNSVPNPEAWGRVLAAAAGNEAARAANAERLRSAGFQPWLAWLAIAAVMGAAAIFLEADTASYVEEVLRPR